MPRIGDDLLKDVHVLLHPIRFRIIELLRDEQLHINEISNILGEDRRLVSYHLLTLEEHGFLDSVFEISERPKSKGKVMRKYHTTSKVDWVLNELKKRI